MNLGLPNQIAGADGVERLGFAAKSRVVLRHRPGVAQLRYSTKFRQLRTTRKARRKILRTNGKV